MANKKTKRQSKPKKRTSKELKARKKTRESAVESRVTYGGKPHTGTTGSRFK